MAIRKTWMGLFPNILKKRYVFQIFEEIPPPPGAAAPGGRRRRRRQGYFSKIFGEQTLFPKYLEKRPIHIFLIATFQFFQITIIYKGTQVTMQSGMTWLSEEQANCDFNHPWFANKPAQSVYVHFQLLIGNLIGHLIRHLIRHLIGHLIIN